MPWLLPVAKGQPPSTMPWGLCFCGSFPLGSTATCSATSPTKTMFVPSANRCSTSCACPAPMSSGRRATFCWPSSTVGSAARCWRSCSPEWRGALSACSRKHAAARAGAGGCRWRYSPGAWPTASISSCASNPRPLYCARWPCSPLRRREPWPRVRCAAFVGAMSRLLRPWLRVRG